MVDTTAGITPDIRADIRVVLIQEGYTDTGERPGEEVEFLTH